MKTLHTDREPKNSVVTDTQVTPNEFLELNKSKIIDLSTGDSVKSLQEPPEKKRTNTWLWVLVMIIVIILVIVMTNYLKHKNNSSNG